MHETKPEKPVDASSDASVSEYVPQAKPDLDMIVPATYKPSKFRFIWIAFIFCLVLSVVGVGAFVIDAENRHIPSQIGTLLTPTPDTINPYSPTVTPQVRPEDVRVRYENKKYHFSFTYPSNWKYKEETSDEIVYPLLDISLMPVASQVRGSISISIYNHGWKDVEDFTKEDCFEKTASCSALMTIAGRSGRRILNPPAPVDIEMVVLQNGKDIYRLILDQSDPKTNTANKKIFEAILASFSFEATPSAKLATPSGTLRASSSATKLKM